jgi:hypothetical protein
MQAFASCGKDPVGYRRNDGRSPGFAHAARRPPTIHDMNLDGRGLVRSRYLNCNPTARDRAAPSHPSIAKCRALYGECIAVYMAQVCTDTPSIRARRRRREVDHPMAATSPSRPVYPRSLPIYRVAQLFSASVEAQRIASSAPGHFQTKSEAASLPVYWSGPPT